MMQLMTVIQLLYKNIKKQKHVWWYKSPDFGCGSRLSEVDVLQYALKVLDKYLWRSLF